MTDRVISDSELIFLEEVSQLAQELLTRYEEMQKLSQDLRELERKYGFSSREFHERWEAGSLSDNSDFFDWNAFYNMYGSARDQANQLMEKLYGRLADRLSGRDQEEGTTVVADKVV